MEFAAAPERKFALSYIRNVGFMGEHYNLDRVYNAAAAYDPAVGADDESEWMPCAGSGYEWQIPDPVTAIRVRRRGGEFKYNLFSDRVLQDFLLPYAVDGVICAAQIFPQGVLRPLYWGKYFALKENYNTPSMIVFERISDESPADFYKAVENLKKQHGINAVPIVIPAGDSGVIDLLEEKYFEFCGKGEVSECPVPEEFSAALKEFRLALISAAAEGDEALMNDVICNKKPDTEQLRKVLRKHVLAGKVVPVLYCRPFARRSFALIYGIELLLDAVADYLPSPADGAEILKIASEEAGIRYCCDDAPFSAVAVVRNSTMACFRVLSGVLTKGSSLLNSGTGKNVSLPAEETVFSGDTFIVTAPHSRSSVNDGIQVRGSYLEIPGADFSKFGLKDLICDADHRVSFRLPALLPEPVLAVTFPFADKKEYDKHRSELEKIKLTFPSLRIFENLSAGTVTGAIDHENLDGFLQCLSVSQKQKLRVEAFCRERLQKKTTAVYEYTDSVGGCVRCVLEVTPMECGHGITVTDGREEKAPAENFFGALREGITEAAWTAEIPGRFPLTDFHVNVLECSSKSGVPAEEAFRKAGAGGLKAAAQETGTELLEPVAKIELRIVEKFLPDFLNELNDLRGTVAELVPGESEFDVRAEVPFAEFDRLTACLRKFQCSPPCVSSFVFAAVPASAEKMLRKSVESFQ